MGLKNGKKIPLHTSTILLTSTSANKGKEKTKRKEYPYLCAVSKAPPPLIRMPFIAPTLVPKYQDDQEKVSKHVFVVIVVIAATSQTTKTEKNTQNKIY